jgi:ABC-type branched-subunit amino acid transport system substrate-binding protein
MVTVQCPNCGERLDAAGSARGQTITCSKCGNRVPTSPDLATSAWSAGEGVSPAPPALTPLPAAAGSASGLSSAGKGDTDAWKEFLEPPRSGQELGWLGPYRVIRLLGKGGMGHVFEAEDTELERTVALKVMSPELANDEGAKQRFVREARATAALHNDHIVTIYHVGVQKEMPYIAMEFLLGEPLDKRLAREGRLPVAEILRIGQQLAAGLSAAHERGLIHRDVKPANIWLEASTGRVKILDFGLARPAADSTHLTRTGIIMGTPSYMAPEQADSRPVDGRSDVFSLGCVLYEMCTGAPPFSGATALTVLKAVMLEEPAPPRKLNPELPQSLSDLISRMLSKDPDGRPQSAAAVAVILERIANNPGARLSALGLPRFAKLSASRRWGLGLAGAAAVAALAYFFGRGALERAGLAPAIAAKAALPKATAIGVTDNEIRLGMSAVFNGPAKELGRGVKLGIETYFRRVNEEGGINGRKVNLIALDDGYEPDRALANMRELRERSNVFGIIGNVGTPTAEKALPYALEKSMPFFGAFTGAAFLRKTPPDRYVFNYRASYGEETAEIARYLVDIRKIKPEAIAVFLQQDAYGDAGLHGVARALRKYGLDADQIVKAGYARNTTDVRAAVEEMRKHPEIGAIIMVAAYAPAARFIQQMRDAKYTGILTNVSFVGSQALSEELMQSGPQYADGIIVTQVVPPVDSKSTVVLKYRELLKQYYPSEQPSFLSLEGYIDALLLTEGLKRAGANLTADTLVDALESIHDLDIGTGAPITFGPSEHQGSHKVWGTVLDKQGRFQLLELD